MVKTISIETFNAFTKKLEKIFCDANKADKRYAEVWLTEEDFGGLPDSEKFVINVKALNEIESCNKEIKYITTELLAGLTKEEISMFWSVNVYNSNDEMACANCLGIPVFNEESCTTN